MTSRSRTPSARRAVAVCASTGNTAASMAAYAARAGIKRSSRSGGRRERSRSGADLDYGATVADRRRLRSRARSRAGARPGRVAIVNSVNPYRIEGQKCAAFVLLEARDWRAPDWLVLPGGNLGNTSAFGKGFREARALGLIDRMPRIAVVQAEGAAPFAHLWRDGGDLVPVNARDERDGDQDRRAGLVAKGVGRSSRLQGTVSPSPMTKSPTRARCRARRSRLRTRLGRLARGIARAARAGAVSSRRRRRARADGPRSQRRRLRGRLPHLEAEFANPSSAPTRRRVRALIESLGGPA